MYRESNQLKIDATLCVGCMKCVAECPRNAIAATEKGVPCAASDGNEKCMHCQHCVMICPAGALSVDGVDPAKCVPRGETPGFELMMNLVRQRRSVRAYRQENVERGVIDSLFDAMRFSPTGVNFHGLSFSVIDNLDRMTAFKKKMYSAIVRLFESSSANDERIKSFLPMYQAIKAGADPVFRSAPHAVIVFCRADAPCAAVDPVIALSYFELLANSRGLGTCWCGWLYLALKYLVPEMTSELGQENGLEASFAMLFGVPEVEFPRAGDPPPVPVVRV